MKPLLDPNKPTCVQCPKSKTKCERTIPCERCFALGLPCRPSECRPCGRKAGAGAAAAGMDGLQDDGEELRGLGQPVMDLVMATADIKANVERYLQAFHQVREGEGIVVIESPHSLSRCF